MLPVEIWAQARLGAADRLATRKVDGRAESYVRVSIIPSQRGKSHFSVLAQKTGESLFERPFLIPLFRGFKLGAYLRYSSIYGRTAK